MIKINKKKYTLIITTVIFSLLFLITLVRADEYWGFDTGQGARQYDAPSNNTEDDSVLGFETRVMYHRESGNPNWYLDELKCAFMISLNPDSYDKYENGIWVKFWWTYYIESIMIEIDITRHIHMFGGNWIVTPLGSGILTPVATGVSEGANANQGMDLMEELFQFIIFAIAGEIHPFFTVLDGVITVINWFIPSGDSFTYGQDTYWGRDWAKFEEDGDDAVTELGLLIYFEPNENIPRSTSTPTQMYHSVRIRYTVEIKKMGWGWDIFNWNGYPIGPITAYTFTNSITIMI
ncbi:MAG: hypothetical protein ACFFA3_10915 [Promethearchaeota archaeon]